MIFWKHHGKKICIAVSIILLLALVTILVSSMLHCKAEDEKRKKYEKAIEYLYMNRAELRNELANLENRLQKEHSIRTGANISLIFLDMDSILYSSVYKETMMKERTEIGMRATICLSPTELPGADGRITREQFDEMTRESCWDTALYYDGDYDPSLSDAADLESFIRYMNDELSSRGIELPGTVVFASGVYNQDTCDAYEETLSRHGIHRLVHTGKSGLNNVDTTYDSEFFRPGAVMWKATALQRNYVAKVLSSGGCGVFTISFYTDDDELLYDPNNRSTRKSFDDMITYLGELMAKGALNVLDMQSARTFSLRHYERMAALEEEIAIERAEIESMIERIDRAIKNFYNVYYNNGASSEATIAELLIRLESLRMQRDEAVEYFKDVNDIPTAANLSVAYLGLDSMIYNSIAAEMTPLETPDTSIFGILCLSESELPGLPGKLTQAQFSELIDGGFDTALYFDGVGEETLQAYLTHMSELLASNDIDMPNCILFAEGAYPTDENLASSTEALLAEFGITNIISYDLDTDVSGAYRINAVHWHFDGLARNFVESVMTEEKARVLTVSFDESSDSYYDYTDGDMRGDFMNLLGCIARNVVIGEMNSASVADSLGLIMDYEQTMLDYKDRLDSFSRIVNIDSDIADAEARLEQLLNERNEAESESDEGSADA